MHLTLVGADLEENLGVGVVASVAERAGWTTTVVPFVDPGRTDEIAAAVLGSQPHVVGLSLQFQHHAHALLTLARTLRREGLRAHLTCGGQWATQGWREALAPRNGIDSVVLREAEQTLPALLHALSEGAPWLELPGLAVRTADGAPTRTEPRGSLEDLDEVPFPKRYRPHDVHFGVPYIPVIGRRGTRRRSPENLAEEMAGLWRQAGGRSIFCLHDDDGLGPTQDDGRTRITALHQALDAQGVQDIGIIAKSKPDILTPDFAAWLARQDVLRLDLSCAASGNSAPQRIDAALDACRDAGLFASYELELCANEAALRRLSNCVAFIRAHPDYPVSLRLDGGRLLKPRALDPDEAPHEDHASLAVRLVSVLFRERSLAPRGVSRRAIELGYGAKVLARFYEHAPTWRAELVEQAARLTRAISLETADLLDEALRLIKRSGDRGRARFETGAAQLASRIAEIDGARHIEIDHLIEQMQRYARGQRAPRTVAPTESWRRTMSKPSQVSKDTTHADVPEIALTAVRHGDAVDATVRVEAPVSLRWQARGRIEGDTETVRWFPADDQDRLVVAVRSEQGLALASVRAKQVA